MTMKITIAAVIFIGSMMLMRADQLVESVQQALKDEGFYYGEVNGDMNANVTAAIRRYQIRNGLQVTGELNDETLRSLGIKSSGSSRSTTKAASPTPAAGGWRGRDQRPKPRHRLLRRVLGLASLLPSRRKPQVQPLRFSLSIMGHKASRFFLQLPWVPRTHRGQFLLIHRLRPLLRTCNAM